MSVDHNVPSASPRSVGAKSPSRLARRGFVLGGLAVVAVGSTRWFNLTAQAGQNGTLSTPDAHAQAKAGQITLVDIRRPDEWRRTGVPASGMALDMRRKDFTDVLLARVGGNKDAPVALICARGVRSRNMTLRLRKAGFTQIIDVPEGMLGSGAGPGWLKRGLPTKKP